MLELQVDVSGDDILAQGYCIVVSTPDGKSYAGFKFQKDLTRALKINYESGKYHYARSKTGKIYFKLRIYCIVVSMMVCFLVKNCRKKEVALYVCRDFDGHKQDIELNLASLLKEVKIVKFSYDTLPKESSADCLAYGLNKGFARKGKKVLFDRRRIIILTINNFEEHLK